MALKIANYRSNWQFNEKGADMNRFKALLKLMLIIGTAMTITACSETTKTVQWQEEVQLNTGEVIWVKRTDTFVKSAEPGNPLQRTWGLQARSYDFSWQGQKFSYQIKTKSGGAILIYVFEDVKSVAIVDSAWPTCTGYGEFRWLNGNWELQNNMSPMLIGKQRNLMGTFDSDGEIPDKVSKAFKYQFDSAPNRLKEIMEIKKIDVATNCNRGK
jgi:hypothetical protein